MKQIEIDLLTKLFDTKAQDTQILLIQAMDDVRRTIAVASAHTDGRIVELNKTFKNYNGRLMDVEQEQLQHKKVIGVLKKMGKYWYVTAGVIVILIFVLIPVVEILGIKELLSFLK
jgi:hypothetical protein